MRGEGGGEGVGETGNLRSPSDCRNAEHLYAYGLYARETGHRAHFSELAWIRSRFFFFSSFFFFFFPF